MSLKQIFSVFHLVITLERVTTQSLQYFADSSPPGLLSDMKWSTPVIEGTPGYERPFGFNTNLVTLPGNDFPSAVMFGARQLTACSDQAALTYLHFDPTGWRWQSFNPPISGMRSNWTGAATFVIYNRYLVVYGGTTCGVRYWNDMYLLDLWTNNGQLISTNTPPPAAFTYGGVLLNDFPGSIVKYSDTEAYYVFDKVYHLNLTNILTSGKAIWSVVSHSMPVLFNSAEYYRQFPVQKLGVTANRTLFVISHNASTSNTYLQTMNLNLTNSGFDTLLIPSHFAAAGLTISSTQRIGDAAFLMADDFHNGTVNFYVLDLSSMSLYKPITNGYTSTGWRSGHTAVVINDTYYLIHGYTGTAWNLNRAFATPRVLGLKFSSLHCAAGSSVTLTSPATTSPGQKLTPTPAFNPPSSPFPTNNTWLHMWIVNPILGIIVIASLWTFLLLLGFSLGFKLTKTRYHPGLLSPVTMNGPRESQIGGAHHTQQRSSHRAHSCRPNRRGVNREDRRHHYRRDSNLKKN